MLEKILGGRYQITSHLGGGGFGKTFLAVDKHLPGNPCCVVKQLKPQTTANPLALQVARRLFNREAEVLYQLGSHPQIPRLFAHFEQEEEFYLVQEFIEGYELRQEISVGKQLPETQVIVLLREILEILAFVHQQNVIHRDIKPSNLIRRQQDGKLVLIDFGAVKQFSNQVIDSEGQTSLTIVVGSLGYMPNEQMAGKPRFCSDIYAVGIIGIQALTGLNPKQLPEDPKTSEIVWRSFVEVCSELADVLDKMVRYDFRQRYQSVSEVLEALNCIPLALLSSTIRTNITNDDIDVSSVPTQTILSDELNSECGIDYTKLRDLLAVGEWKEADRETGLLMLKICDREEEGWIRNEDIEKLPYQDLRTIDGVWRRYSNGRFGFRVQQRIWESMGNYEDKNYEIWCSFGDCIGWRVNGSWLTWNDLNFTLNASTGHLPALAGRGLQEWFLYFFYRIKTCYDRDDSTPSLTKIKLESLNEQLSSENEINYTGLTSEYGLDYTRLQDLLAAGKWKEADLETKVVMVQVANRNKEGWLNIKDIEMFSCQDLRTIDNLWVKYSNGHFGFSVQQSIWESIQNTKDGDSESWNSFGDRVGWKTASGSWLSWDKLTFSSNAPVGHLPASITSDVWGASKRLLLNALLSRMQVCGQDNVNNNKSVLAELDSADDLYEKGNTLYEQENYQEAIAIYKKAILLEPNHYLAWFMLGKTFNKCNLLEKELFSYKKAIEIKDDYQEAWFMQAMALEKLERNEEAIASYDRVIEIQPNHFWAWRERGKILEKLQRYKEAADSYQRAIIIKSDFQLAIEGRKRSLNKLISNQSKTLIVNVDNINSDRREDEDSNRQTSVKARIAIVEGDITKQRVDAIVNATDLWFSGGGGVDRAIHRAAGPQLRQECNQLIGRGWATGEAEITNGYNLTAKWIIHTVGPIWRGGNHQEEQKLAQCYTNCLALAEQHSIKTIAFPAISTGAFGFPIELATKIAVSETKFFLERHSSIENVIFVCFGQKAYDCYLNAVNNL